MKNLELLETMRNEIKKGKGKPIAAVILRDGEVISSAANAKTKNGLPDTDTHAEKIILDGFSETGDLTLVVSVPPCPTCMGLIEKNKGIREVKWLFKKWGKGSITTHERIKMGKLKHDGNDEKRLISKMNGIYQSSEKNKVNNITNIPKYMEENHGSI